MNNGTGIQRVWYDDGTLQLEFSTVRGETTGRKRFWLRDGSLVSEKWRIAGREVSRDEYLSEAASHPDWPRYPRERNHVSRLTPERFESRAYKLHCQWLLSRPDKRDAVAWLNEGRAKTRALGRLPFSLAKSLIAAVANSGAAQMLSVDICCSKSRKEFCDALLIRLPKAKRLRRAIREIFESLPSRAHCAVQPGTDRGEKWLYVYFG